MQRKIRLDLERLESKALMSVAPASTSGLVESLTAVASKTTLGVQVVTTFTMTNVSNQDITVDNGPSIDGFQATQGGKVVWTSNGGVNPDFIMLDDLKPHQSLTLKATWDGHRDEANPSSEAAEGPSLTGTFTISNELDPGGATAIVTIPKTGASSAKTAPVHSPTPPAPHRR